MLSLLAVFTSAAVMFGSYVTWYPRNWTISCCTKRWRPWMKWLSLLREIRTIRHFVKLSKVQAPLTYMDQWLSTCSFPKFLQPTRFYQPHRPQCRIQDGRENVRPGVSINFRPMFPKYCKKKWPRSYIPVSPQIGNDRKSSAKALGKTTISKAHRLLTFQRGFPVF